MAERYVVQVENWGELEDDQSFSDPSEAARYAHQHFPHNVWRVWDSLQSELVAMCETGMASDMSAEAYRFRRSQEWLNDVLRRQERRALVAAVRENSETFSTIVSVANRQRTYDNERRRRRRSILDVLEEDDAKDFCKPKDEFKLCWKKNGF